MKRIAAVLVALVAATALAAPAHADVPPFPKGWRCVAVDPPTGPAWNCKGNIRVQAGRAGAVEAWAQNVARDTISARATAAGSRATGVMMGCEHVKRRTWTCSGFWSLPRTP